MNRAKKAALLVLGLVLMTGTASAAGFQRVSAHVFYLQPKSGGWNTGAVITTEGVLIVDPPAEPDIPAMLASLKAVTARAVRWVASTDYQVANAGGLNYFARQGAAIICSRELDRLAGSAAQADPSQPAAARPQPRLVFSSQMQLFPDAVEIRLLGLKGKARTAGDVVVYFPGEKAMFAGNLFTPGRFPDIDSGHGEGSATGWIDALKQAIDFVPLLKSAMPQPRQEPAAVKTAEPEKSAEELVAIIGASGAAATLQNMKELFSAAQKMRPQATRTIAAGRSREDFVKSLPGDIFGQYANYEAFAAQLYDDLQKK